ncbi:hypothetical protein B0T21DRAFT_367123 [Apiosordaria backusii]|uniref:Uncharacterized protein n=1 Tax=Apiosordaria backusii TaxID=314023 RepID=A0AA40BLP3_9PEZI|nr:hypothetical protein B0T21DRAFT_367123 [Apiosordaria backusii]
MQLQRLYLVVYVVGCACTDSGASFFVQGVDGNLDGKTKTVTATRGNGLKQLRRWVANDAKRAGIRDNDASAVTQQNGVSTPKKTSSSRCVQTCSNTPCPEKREVSQVSWCLPCPNLQIP